MKNLATARREMLIKKAHSLLDEAEKCIKEIVKAVNKETKKAA